MGNHDQLHVNIPILLVDDEQTFLSGAQMALEYHGYAHVDTCSDSREVMGRLKGQVYGVVILDITMPHVDGSTLLTQIVSEYPDMPVIMLTALSETQLIVNCIKAGAYNYILKPLDADQFIIEIERALADAEADKLQSRIRERLLSGHLNNPDAFSEIVTQNTRMTQLFRYIEAIAPSPQPVLIFGETGTGKESLAKSIHLASQRDGEYVSVNVAGLDDELFSDTLLGHAKGAFTGAVSERQGLIDRAKNGTIFLDEIGDLSPLSQIKLLRLLQEREYMRLGEDTPHKTNARVVVATNIDLNKAQQAGSFRKDLFYRLKTHQMELPPLRERLDDVVYLLDHFMQLACDMLSREVPPVSSAVLPLLQSYQYPGNIRELQAMVVDAVSRHMGGELESTAFANSMEPASRADRHAAGEAALVSGGSASMDPEHFLTLKENTERHIEAALTRCNGNQSMASKLLGISRQALNQRLKK